MKDFHKVLNYRMHGSSGESVKRDQWVDWVLSHQDNFGATLENGYGFGL